MNDHRNGTGFVLAAFLAVVAPVAPAAIAEGASHLGPAAVVAARDGRSLFVAHADAKQIAVVDPGGRVVRTIAVPAEPTGMALSGDATTLWVTCPAPKSIVCAVDVASGKITALLEAGHTAIGPALSPDGKRLYVCNRFDNDVSGIDLMAKKEIARVAAVRQPIAAAITPDGKTVFVLNHLLLDRADGHDAAASVTVIDTADNSTITIRLPNGSTCGRGICVSPDGKHAFVTHLLGRYHMPITSLERGWTNTNALTVIDAAERKWINTVLLDEIDRGAADPWGVACSNDGKTVCVALAGTHELGVIDVDALLKKLASVPADDAPLDTGRITYSSQTVKDIPNDLAFLAGIRRRIPLSAGDPAQPADRREAIGPRGLAILGTKAYVACYFSDNLAVVELTPDSDDPDSEGTVERIALGPKPKLTTRRRGEILFHDAGICYRNWQSCASCHPEGRGNALNWDLLHDGLSNPKDVRSMLLAHQTPPSMASAVRPDAETAVRKLLMHLMFVMRPEEDAAAIDTYLKSLKPVPSPHLIDGKLSPAARRGKRVFFDENVGCAKCHPKPLYTDRLMHDVGSRGQYDRRTTFDTPTLIECWRTAPYMHDGRHTTLTQLFTTGRHGRQDTDTSHLATEQIDDLVEFVLSL